MPDINIHPLLSNKQKTDTIKQIQLKTFLRHYGELDALSDISIIFQELSQEWKEYGNIPLAHKFSNAANSIADVGHQLKAAEEQYLVEIGLDDPEAFQRKLQLEYEILMQYFTKTSVPELGKAYTKNKSEMLVKLTRLNYLKKYLSKLSGK